MRRRLTAILCAVLVLQFSAGAAPGACAGSHGTPVPAGTVDEHAHHASAAAASVPDETGVPDDNCDQAASSECCVPAVSCGLTLSLNNGHAPAMAPGADDGRSADPVHALPRDPAARRGPCESAL